MEIDMGASLTLVSERTLHDLWPDICVTPSKVKLHSYSGESIPVLGTVDVLVKYGHQSVSLPLQVVKGTGPSLLGRNWLGVIKLDWHEIFWLQNASLAEVLDKHKAVFEPSLGKVTGYEAKIIVDPTVPPKYSKARSVPYFYQDKVNKEFDRLVEEGTLEPVKHFECASLIIPVLKPDKQSVRICGDFKRTVNLVSKLDRYPIPRIEDLFAQLSKGKRYTKLDLSQVYLQVPLDKELKKPSSCEYPERPFPVYPTSLRNVLCVRNFPENVLQGIPNVIVY